MFFEDPLKSRRNDIRYFFTTYTVCISFFCFDLTLGKKKKTTLIWGNKDGEKEEKRNEGKEKVKKLNDKNWR